jgi:hypothetical protein
MPGRRRPELFGLLTMDNLLADIASAESRLAELHQSVKDRLPNIHQVHRDLDRAQGHFEDGFLRLTHAASGLDSPWPNRHS